MRKDIRTIWLNASMGMLMFAALIINSSIIIGLKDLEGYYILIHVLLIAWNVVMLLRILIGTSIKVDRMKLMHLVESIEKYFDKNHKENH